MCCISAPEIMHVMSALANSLVQCAQEEGAWSKDA